MQKAEIDTAINQAVQEAAEQGFHGHANTPFILSRIKELTHGSSLPANRALIESNVAMAAKVAVQLSKFEILASEEPFPEPQIQYLDTHKRRIEVDRRRPNKLLTALDASRVIGNAGIDKGYSATEVLSAERKPRIPYELQVPVGSPSILTGSKWYKLRNNFQLCSQTLYNVSV